MTRPASFDMLEPAGYDPARPPPEVNEEAKLAKEPALPKDIAALSFEDALKELEGIVQQLERGQVKLDEAISAYERGALLKRHCEQRLARVAGRQQAIHGALDGLRGERQSGVEMTVGRQRHERTG
jgi:exodeoxyribonuclease VII small subunit